MESEIKVSVIMPVYNGEKYLKPCLDSVCAQTLREIEIICVDDGSTDTSLSILEGYQKKDSRIQVLHQQNQYAGVARNHGLAQAKGKYVIFWDSDDFFHRDALQKLYRQGEAEQAQIVVCGARKYEEELQLSYRAEEYLVRSRLPKQRPFSKKEIGRYLFNFASNVPWNKLFLRSFVQTHELQFQPLKQANDVYFVMQALYLAERITIVKKPLIDYRVANASSLTGKVSETSFASAQAFLAVQEFLEQSEGYTDDLRQSFVNKCFGPLIHSLRGQGSPESYEKVYREYRETIFPKLGLFGHEAAYFNARSDHEELEQMQQLDDRQYLLYQMQRQDRKFRVEKAKTANIQTKLIYKVWREVKRRMKGHSHSKGSQ